MLHYLFIAPKLNLRNLFFMIYNIEIISAEIFSLREDDKIQKFIIHLEQLTILVHVIISRSESSRLKDERQFVRSTTTLNVVRFIG